MLTARKQEFVGSHQSVAETNFYSKGVNDYTHSDKINVAFNPMTEVHTYTLDWTADYITYSIDGQIVRTAKPAEANGGSSWPQTPAQIRLGTWVGGGQNSPEGTTTWAGGKVDWSQGPFAAIYRSIKVTDYAGGFAGATEYSYGDKSGSWKSIKVKGGKESSMPGLPASVTSSNSPSAVASTSAAASLKSNLQSDVTTSTSSAISTPVTVSTSYTSSSTMAVNASSTTRSSKTPTSSPQPTGVPSAGSAASSLSVGLLALLAVPFFL